MAGRAFWRHGHQDRSDWAHARRRRPGSPIRGPDGTRGNKHLQARLVGRRAAAFIVLLIALVPVCVVLIRSALRAESPTPIVVNTTDDPNTDVTHCGLHDAITAANSGSVTPVNACVASGSGTDIINFDSSIANQTITLGSSLPTIPNPENLTIDGTTESITVDGASSFQILAVNSGATLTVNNLTLADGITGSGGAISNSGTLTVTNSTLSDNAASDTGPGGGGGIYNLGMLTVTGSTFSGNDTTGSDWLRRRHR